MSYPVRYLTVNINGLLVFYREAGRRDAPVLLLLHGLPSSSRMYATLIERLADEYRLIAPDYPGFGHSDWPDPKQFDYTFDNIAAIIGEFTEALSLTAYTLYMQDYGGPIGFRLALAHPERVNALIIQNAVAHNEGLGAAWDARRKYWQDRDAHEVVLRANLFSFSATRLRHVGSDPDVERYDPNLWADEYAFLNQPGQIDIQCDLFFDYQSNVASYRAWQEWMRKVQPRLLVLWGKYDKSFEISEVTAYRRDVPTAEVHILEAGHFALDTTDEEISILIRKFMKGQCPSFSLKDRNSLVHQ